MLLIIRPLRARYCAGGIAGKARSGVPDLASPVRSRYFLFEGYAADVVPRPSMAARDQRSAWPSMRRKGFSVSSQAEAAQRRTMSPSRQRVTLCVSRSLCPAGIPLILYWCWQGSCAGNRDRPNHLEESAWKRPNAGLKSYEHCNCWSVSKPRKLPALRNLGVRGLRHVDLSKPRVGPEPVECAATECESRELIRGTGCTKSFRGTCYRAANWLNLGQTADRVRTDREYQSHTQAVKDLRQRSTCIRRSAMSLRI